MPIFLFLLGWAFIVLYSSPPRSHPGQKAFSEEYFLVFLFEQYL
jgi:hypothetical protein